jgi:hypothetical protein
MFTFLSTISRPARLSIWRSTIRPFSCFDHLRQASARSAEEEAAHLARRRLAHNTLKKQRYAEDPEFRQKVLDYKQQRYANDPEYRQRSRAYPKKYTRRPDKRDAAKVRACTYREKHREQNNAYAARAHEDLGRRRTNSLYVLLNRGVADRYTWETHTPIRYPDRVDHHCTGCNRDRFLNTWWKQKSSRLEPSEHSDPDRYMCSHCFANDWPRVVPETYTGNLPKIFRSPDFPRSKVQQKEHVKEKVIESDKL